MSADLNPALTQFLDLYGDGDGVFYLGHASILAVIGGKKILFDPIVESRPYGDSWVFYPPQVADPRWYEVDAVLVSHIHQDHYDLKYLKRLRPEIPVFIIGQRPSFEADIVARSGRAITIVAPETVTQILPGVNLYGVIHESNGIDASAIVYNQRFCVYHGNDNYLQPASLAKFSAVRPRIDVACIPYAYIHWYPFLMEYAAGKEHEKAAESARLVNLYMDDALAATAILRPTVMIPFGANLLIDDGDMHSEINLAVKTPIEFVDYARATMPERRDVFQPMLAGDYCGAGPDGLALVIGHDYDSDDYRRTANTFLQGRPQKTPPPDLKPVDLAAFVATLNQRLAGCTAPIDNVLRVDMHYLGQRVMIEVDCLDYQARAVDRFDDSRPDHHFKLDPVSAALWLNGKRMEVIIGMRRFTLRREPNLYLPDVLKIVNTVL